MNPRERVQAALAHREADRVPRFEIWIDALFDELGQRDPVAAYANLGQDCIMMPSQTPQGSNAWGDGIDEWGRTWRKGMYTSGAVDTETDLRRYSPPTSYVAQFFDPDRVREARARYPDHCLIYGTHIGPFTAGYLAMGFERFFTRMYDDPAFVHALLAHRTAWCIALYRRAIELGAEVLVLGDDAAHGNGPMISPRLWREHVWPYHRRIVDALDVPVIWHSDGDIRPLLCLAAEAGFAGVHGLEPAAGIDLGWVKREFGRDLVLVGNVDVNALCGREADPDAVRREVRRCVAQGAPGAGFMIATCNSIYQGLNPARVAEMFRYEEEMGGYPYEMKL